MKLKCFSHLLFLALCLNCLSATSVTTAEKETVETLLLKQIDDERLAYQLYTKLSEIHPKITIYKDIIATEKRHFSTLEDYARETYPNLKTGRLKGPFLNNENRKLYQRWLTKGKVSQKNAAQVGVDLEEMDIENVEHFLSPEPEPELATILENLKQDSKKHLSAFRRQKTR